MITSSRLDADFVLHLEVLGTHFLIEADQRWIDFIEQLWAPFVKKTDSSESRIVHIVERNSRWRLQFMNSWAVEDVDPWSLVNQLRNAMFQSALDETYGKIVAVHAAVVSRQGSCLLLAGPSGAGKTTLTLELLRRGWAYYSDDLAPIQVSSGAVSPFPKPLHVRDPALWATYLPHWEPPNWVAPPKRSFLLPARVFGTVPEHDGEPRHLIFPRYSPGAEPGLRSISCAHAVARSAQTLQPFSQLGGPAIAVLARLSKGVRAAEAVYGSSAEGAEMIERWLRDRDNRGNHVGDETEVKI